jgi:hypothetical protein
MRESCTSCTRKHLANAVVLSHEVVLGYKEFAWLVVGHLCQAEEEITRANLDIATAIRQFRLQYMQCIENDFKDLSNVPNFMLLIEMVTAFHLANLPLDEASEEAQPNLFNQPQA